MTKNGMVNNSSPTSNGRDALPIEAFKAAIIGCAAPYMIVEAETGSGKSTMVPQWYHELGNSVLVTEPLIETVIGTSEYVAQLMGVPFGTTVGYRTGKGRQDSAETSILFCTDGLALVRELAGHNRFDILIIDELHEWNTNQSTLEAWAWKHLQEGNSVFKKIVVLSATLASDELARKRGNAPVFKVPGRQFPIVDRPAGATIEADIAKLVAEGFDVLCFQPGEAEIVATVARLQSLDAELIPFYGKLKREEKDRAYKRYDRPKVVVSTNALETGRTLVPSPGRRLAVVDSGMERRVELVSGVEGLYLKPIAKARGQQRRGRTGRLGEGVYIDHCPSAERPGYPVPEIMRTRLDQTVLRLAIAGYDAAELPFFHQLDRQVIADAKKALKGLGAIDQAGKVTEVGYAINRLPIEVHSARMILEAAQRGVVDDVIVIAACLDAGDIVARSGEWRSFFGVKETESDLLAQLAVLVALIGQNTIEHLLGTAPRQEVFNKNLKRKQRESRREQVKRALREADRSLKQVDWREAGIVGMNIKRAYAQIPTLADAVRGVGDVEFGSFGSQQDTLKACSTGLVDHLYRKSSSYSGRYQNGGNGERELAKESCLMKRSSLPEWLVGQPFDLGITDRRGRSMTLRLIKNASAVDPTWLAEVAPHLASNLCRNYRWSEERGEVVCDEVLVFNGTEVATTVVAAQRNAEATKALADQFARVWLGEVGQAVNAELTELQAKSGGAVRGPLTQSEAAKIYAERLGEIYRMDDPAIEGIDFGLARATFVSGEEATYIREQAPDTVLIGGEVCNVEYKYDSASYYSSEKKQTVTIQVSVATIQNADQAVVEHLIPSGASYTLKLQDKGYTAISGTDVSTLREQIEAQRLELAWQAFTTNHPDTTLVVKGLEPLPAVAEPEIYDAVTGAFAYPAFRAYYASWYQKWYRTCEEAQTSQAEAIKAKAKLDAEEDERRNRDRYVAEAQAEADAVAQLLAGVNLDEYQAYGLTSREAGKDSWYESEGLSAKIEQARALLRTSDGYYSRTPEPKKALDLLATVRARVELALAHHQTNETKRPEAETALALIREEQETIATYERDGLLSYKEEREVERLATEATEAFKRHDFVSTCALFEELSVKTAELQKKAEDAKRQKEELKRSANDRLRTLLGTCPVCSHPMVEEHTEWGDQTGQTRLVCRQTNLHPINRVVWAQSNSGLTQYDEAVLAEVRPEGTHKRWDAVATVKIFIDGTVAAEWFPTDCACPLVRNDFTGVILTDEAWAARNRERYEADYQRAEEMVSQRAWFKLSFRQGRHPKTGELQWEAGSKHAKFVLDRRSPEPVAGKSYYVSEVRELVNTGSFRLTLVRLEPPFPEDKPQVPEPEVRASESAGSGQSKKRAKAREAAPAEPSAEDAATAQAQIEALKARFNRR
ncbi:hypothetical protein HYW32_01710 [Candidatus Berkelbacteria bacterium]|nr:hypothetical protein [Candidatus Berkelbacteria bacterium]